MMEAQEHPGGSSSTGFVRIPAPSLRLALQRDVVGIVIDHRRGVGRRGAAGAILRTAHADGGPADDTAFAQDPQEGEDDRNEEERDHGRVDEKQHGPDQGGRKRSQTEQKSQHQSQVGWPGPAIKGCYTSGFSYMR